VQRAQAAIMESSAVKSVERGVRAPRVTLQTGPASVYRDGQQHSATSVSVQVEH
jgi:hypothetical protein